MLGDAVGHGVPAALVTAVAFSATRMLDMNASTDSSSPLAPSVILSNLNNVLCDMNSEMACMTFFILRVHDDTGDCVFANAGNPQPALIPSDSADDRLAKGQRFKTLLARGDVLGLSADATFAEHQITLKPGDRIVMYTDGLVENTAESSREPIGKIWLKQKLNHLANESAPSLREQLWDAYLKSIGSVPPADDVTLVVISRT